jgi:hypothetical protein
MNKIARMFQGQAAVLEATGNPKVDSNLGSDFSGLKGLAGETGLR